MNQTELTIDFSKPNHRLNTDRSNVPLGWSCDWARFDGSDFILAPCINGRIRQNAVLERCYSTYGDIFFVMYKVGSYKTILRCGDDTRQYYLFNFDTDKLYKFTKKYPTLEAFMERATLWINGDAQIYSVTPFAAAEIKAGRVSVRELELAWDLEEEAIEGGNVIASVIKLSLSSSRDLRKLFSAAMQAAIILLVLALGAQLPGGRSWLAMIYVEANISGDAKAAVVETAWGYEAVYDTKQEAALRVVGLSRCSSRGAYGWESGLEEGRAYAKTHYLREMGGGDVRKMRGFGDRHVRQHLIKAKQLDTHVRREEYGLIKSCIPVGGGVPKGYWMHRGRGDLHLR
ncbi:uncharacterized protein EV420DRAFT_1487942 [Desarmillaria tabescens]|uniref:Uncharacterized protein n=1 Tax=Armillaria tabescens TaxID=1929756 RepID=A0AA39J4Q5_ARMTA|nr:uncharacterized protein EV420DRAFT_1487942 [Desarmillaria tabescens]KAK0435569.1 hypothetical protein EV420DRAFT_1487942 [Desarmillaria tabescens]